MAGVSGDKRVMTTLFEVPEEGLSWHLLGFGGFTVTGNIYSPSWPCRMKENKLLRALFKALFFPSPASSTLPPLSIPVRGSLLVFAQSHPFLGTAPVPRHPWGRQAPRCSRGSSLPESTAAWSSEHCLCATLGRDGRGAQTSPSLRAGG